MKHINAGLHRYQLHPRKLEKLSRHVQRTITTFAINYSNDTHHSAVNTTIHVPTLISAHPLTSFFFLLSFPQRTNQVFLSLIPTPFAARVSYLMRPSLKDERKSPRAVAGRRRREREWRSIYDDDETIRCTL